jgi:GrpB-like predicted nucleotidyltransferase (UPF0157 family)/heme-degrading monooxygenase HmoA
VETPEQKIARVVKEHVAVVPYDPAWPERFEQERDHLLSCLPSDLIRRIEHFGSTAVPGLAAKPIVDVLVEVADLEETRRRIAPVLEAQGYDYFWRPSAGDDTPPFYAWFIKRDERGVRTHHIHMVEAQFEHWDRLLFRDYLIQHPEAAREYAELKLRLAEAHGGDRVAYTKAKSDFVAAVTARARRHHAAREVGSVVLSVFRSRLRPENEAEFQALAARMLELAEAMPGFVSYKLFVSSDGERCSLVEFETEEQLRAWRELPAHREAQRIGRERYYAEYRLQVFERPVRESRFEHGGQRKEDG